MLPSLQESLDGGEGGSERAARRAAPPRSGDLSHCPAATTVSAATVEADWHSSERTVMVEAQVAQMQKLPPVMISASPWRIRIYPLKWRQSRAVSSLSV